MKVKASLNQVISSIALLYFSLTCHFAMASTFEKIVVSGGSITEIIYALGEQDRIVGVDSTSVFPSEATNKPQVGYVRRINVEGILSLNPDLLLGEEDTGPKKVLQQLKKTGLKTHIFKEHDNFEGIEHKIRHIAQLLNVEEKGEQLNRYIQADRKALAHLLSQTKIQPNVLFVLSLRAGKPMVAGKNTSAHQVITAAGGFNIASNSFSDWKPLSTESAMAMNPDVIITMGRHGQLEKLDVSKLPHFKHSNAVKNKKVFTFDGSYLLGMGPRTPQAVVELAKAIHTNLQYPAGYELRAAQSSESDKVL